MEIQIDTKSRLPIIEQITGQIAALIRSGRFSAGGELPSVHELADLLQISRMTTGRAYEQLCKNGLIEKTDKAGHYIVSCR